MVPMQIYLCRKNNKHTGNHSFQTKKIFKNSKKKKKNSALCFQSVDLRESLKLSEKKMSHHFTCILLKKGWHLCFILFPWLFASYFKIDSLLVAELSSLMAKFVRYALQAI